MKKLILSAMSIAILTACPSKEEVRKMQDSIALKKQTAIQLLEKKDYSLEGLLKIQEYFFDFSEKTHLIKVEAEAQKELQKLIKKKGGAKEFCESYVLPLKYWQPLEAYCSNGFFYKCSPEINEYKNILSKLKEFLGAETKKLLESEATCL